MEQYAWLAVLTLAQVIQFLVVKSRDRGYKYNPHPPGEANQCKANKKKLDDIDGKLDIRGERLAAIETRVKDMDKRLDRIEGKLNGAR